MKWSLLAVSATLLGGCEGGCKGKPQAHDATVPVHDVAEDDEDFASEDEDEGEDLEDFELDEPEDPDLYLDKDEDPTELEEDEAGATDTAAG